jgi:hypothetical protein
VDEEEKNQSKKVKVEVVITRYEEAPQFFDQEGNPKTYKVKVDTEYKILCEDSKESSGKFSVQEFFYKMKEKVKRGKNKDQGFFIK